MTVQGKRWIWEDRLIEAWEHYYGRFFLKMLSFRRRSLFRNIQLLSEHLENQVFPTLRECENAVTIHAVKEGQDCYITEGRMEGANCVFNEQNIRLPGTAMIADALILGGIKHVWLDVRLESNQIVEAFLILLSVGECSHYSPKRRLTQKWNLHAICSALLSAEGLHLSCALMRFYPERQVFAVEYSYCELFFSKVIKSYLKSRSRLQDHRYIFQIAPRAAFLTLFLMALPIVFMRWNQTAAEALWLGSVIVYSLSVWFLLRVIGSIQYDWEYYNSLNKEHVRQVSLLSRFPMVNPNLIFRLDEKGVILYANPAAAKFLHEIGGSEKQMDSILPSTLREAAALSLKQPNKSVMMEVEACGRIFQYYLSPFPDKRTIFLAGVDITRLRTLERNLRDLNQNLEVMVAAKTDELQKTQEVTILCLAGLAETRDPETGEHLERTRSYVKALAQHLKNQPRFRNDLSDAAIENLYKSTPLHDIGKVGINDSILLKPGRLTAEEFDEMKKHTIYGANALRWAEERLGFDSFLRTAKEIANFHHEKWDGSGYPEGRKGDTIPVSARLMAVADVYDALVSKRVYKEAFSHERAKELIVKDKGWHFDPMVVDAFLAIENEFIAICASYGQDRL